MGIFDSIVGAVFGKAIPEFQVKIAVGMRKLNNGTNHNSVSFQFIGKIGNFYQSPSSIAILLRDGADDMPMLSGDAGRPEWGFVPVENISQIEVIGNNASVCGFYSYGEIAPFDQEINCQLHNQTIAITLISE